MSLSFSSDFTYRWGMQVPRPTFLWHISRYRLPASLFPNCRQALCDPSKICGTDNILNACTEHFVLNRLVEECLDTKITVSGIECVTGHHVQFRILIFPACHFDFCDDTHRTVRDDTFRTGSHRSDMSCFLSVPSFESTRTQLSNTRRTSSPNPLANCSSVG